MFGFFKKNKEKAKAGQSAAVRAQAMENMRGARARLGDETIQQMAAALRERENSPVQKAEQEIKKYDKGRIADNIKAMMDDK